MSDSPADLDRLLDRVLAGEASAAEQAQAAEWAAADPRRAALLRGVPDQLTTPAVDTDAAWAALSARLDAPVVRPITSAPSMRRPARWPRVAAAAALVLAAIGGWRALAPSTIELVAPTGQRVSRTLPDGSTITLAAGSRARWSRDFGAATREVQLDGEGYFDVVHDTTRPFRVRARDGVAEDVGTRFVVRAWPELPHLEVAVEEGIVALADTAQARSARGTLLSAGQRGVLTDDGRVAVSTDVDEALGWIRGELVFDDTPLREALPAIGRWYGVTLTADATMADRRLTARFAQQPLEQLLEALGLALNARVRRDGTSITLAPN